MHIGGIFSIRMKGMNIEMAKERITVSIADLKMNLLTADADAVRKMTASLDARISRLAKRAGGSKNVALVLLVMEMAESQKRSAELIHAQQEQIFALLQKNAVLSGGEVDMEHYEILENSLQAEIDALNAKNNELIELIAELKGG